MSPADVLTAYLIVILWALWEAWLLLDWRRRVARAADSCQVTGCGGHRYGTVGKGIEVMPVCIDHSDELTIIYGWDVV